MTHTGTTMMNVKDAVKAAIQQVSDLFELDENSNVGLEEVVYTDNPAGWNITVGFSRPWDRPQPGIVTALQALHPTRQYRVVKILENGDIHSVTMRQEK